MFSRRLDYEKEQEDISLPLTPLPRHLLNEDNHFYCCQVKDSDSTQPHLTEEQQVLSGQRVQSGAPLKKHSIIVLK